MKAGLFKRKEAKIRTTVEIDYDDLELIETAAKIIGATSFRDYVRKSAIAIMRWKREKLEAQAKQRILKELWEKINEDLAQKGLEPLPEL